MAVFGRQKRQSRFYWAELGFMALGLLGLQPNLFMSLFTGSPSKPASYADQNYPPAPPPSLDFYREWAALQLASFMTQPISGPISTPNGWAPAPINGSQVPSTNFGQPGYAAIPYSSAQAYGPPPYAAQNYAPSYTNSGQLMGPPNAYSPNAAQPNYAPQQHSSYAQSAYSPMQPSGNGPYSPAFSTAANPYAYPNPATQANGYGSTFNGSQPKYQPSSSYSTGYGVPTANNANSYGNGGGTGNYSNPQSNTGVSSGTWQRYQAPTSSTYYR